VGPGQFKVHYPYDAHSTYVRVLAEQGFLGLSVWLAVAGVTLFLALRNAFRGWDTYGIGSAALLGSWCGLLINSAVVDTLHWRHLWVVASLIWAAEARRRFESSTGLPPTDLALLNRTSGRSLVGPGLTSPAIDPADRQAGGTDVESADPIEHARGIASHQHTSLSHEDPTDLPRNPPWLQRACIPTITSPA
jgi:hypothetical protein